MAHEFHHLQTGGFADEDLVKDGWTDLSQRIRDRMVEMVNDDPSAFSREAFVPPTGTAMTKRWRDPGTGRFAGGRRRHSRRTQAVVSATLQAPVLHDEYLQSYNNPNTRLIDTDGKGVTEITPTGVVVGDTHYELDCPFSPRASRSARPTPDAPASRRPVATVSPSPSTGRPTAAAVAASARNVHGFPNLFVVQGSLRPPT